MCSEIQIQGSRGEKWDTQPILQSKEIGQRGWEGGEESLASNAESQAYLMVCV